MRQRRLVARESGVQRALPAVGVPGAIGGDAKPFGDPDKIRNPVMPLRIRIDI